MEMPFNQIEREVIILNAVLELIDEMVNYEMFVKLRRTSDAELRFNTSTHQRLFNIILVDFLSQPQIKGQKPIPFDLPKPHSSARPSDYTYLFYIRSICDDPKLSHDVCHLRAPIDAFADWLDAECLIEQVWLPSIDTELDIRVPRITFLKICGDIGKHNFARLEGNVKKICGILAKNHHMIDEGKGYLVLPEFYDWFHKHVFAYHASAIAEFLNNIRWGIYDYLGPEFAKSFTKDNPTSIAYRYIYPQDCNRPIAQAMYWSLMNAVRSEPHMPRFDVTRFLKMRY
ncbi:hypothetical protein [Methylocystis sp. Sn-Cys]|uniref:hypothetical protein n=1 Tax=Methylocystis sp. Sn-Cys TaxID=1701263 RepID=UPI001921D4DB|nr:hypothetical protein [Methylocystis sp. Sn-Cys]MBL1255461.1 hypothetical protein [Methylocystis sp. Sn-Cys]